MAGLRALSGTGWKTTRDLDEVADIYETFKDPHARAAIRHVVRAVVDWRGQIVTMADRAYLTEEMPMAVVWGRDDKVIPVRHASNAAALAPKARIEVIPNAGHFPHKDHPQRFAKILHDFIRTTRPAAYSRAKFRTLLRNGQVGPVSPVEPPDRRPRQFGLVSIRAARPSRRCSTTETRWSSLPRPTDYASPPSCLRPATAVGSSMRYFANASVTFDLSISPASARAWRAWTTTDSASTWK